MLSLAEEERGQSQPQLMCYVTRFIKNEFISSDAMSKLRQVQQYLAWSMHFICSTLGKFSRVSVEFSYEVCWLHAGNLCLETVTRYGERKLLTSKLRLVQQYIGWSMHFICSTLGKFTRVSMVFYPLVRRKSVGCMEAIYV